MTNFKRRMNRQRRPGPTGAIPNTYAKVPHGFTEDAATMHELHTAGFHGALDVEDKPGTPPIDELAVDGQTLTPDQAAALLRQVHLKVLRDPGGQIVATWDEGRWWTPEESDEFTRRIVAELRA